MTAPNHAVDAKPGDRFTDPDGGTWDRCMGTANDEVLEAAANLADRMADRLDRERAEAAQDAADRKRAEEIAHRWGIDETAHDAHVEFVLAGICAERERAERQEAEK